MEDSIRRWITGEGTFRILAASARRTVTEAVSIMQCAPDVGALYGEFLVGAALYQLALAPAERVQFSVEHEGTAGNILADIRPGVHIRGQLENPRAEGALLGPGASMRVSRQGVGSGGQYESIIKVPGRKIADSFQVCALQSDQVLSFMALDTHYQNEKIQRADGLFVQALPGATHEHLAKITACLEQTRFEDQLIAAASPFEVVESMFYGLDLHDLGEDPLEYRCGCTKASLVAALGTLSEDDLREMVEEGKAEMLCEFCRTTYRFSAKDLEEIRQGKEQESGDPSP